MELKKLLSIPKTAEILDVSPFLVRQEIYRRRLACVRVGRTVLIDPRDLAEYLAANRKAAK